MKKYKNFLNLLLPPRHFLNFSQGKYGDNFSSCTNPDSYLHIESLSTLHFWSLLTDFAISASSCPRWPKIRHFQNALSIPKSENETFHKIELILSSSRSIVWCKKILYLKKFWYFVYFWNLKFHFPEMVKKGPWQYMWEVEKKVRKWKSEIEEKFNQKHFSKDRTSAKTSALMSIVSVYLLWSSLSTHTFSYFYDIEILCEKQSHFHCVPRGKEDYCINIYMILMLILALANPAMTSLRWTSSVSPPLSVWHLNFFWKLSRKLLCVFH